MVVEELQIDFLCKEMCACYHKYVFLIHVHVQIKLHSCVYFKYLNKLLFWK